MDRRTLLALAGGLLSVPHALFAQTAKRVYRIATLDDSVEGSRAQLWQLFRSRLRELLLKDGNDAAYEARYARGDSRALPTLATDEVIE